MAARDKIRLQYITFESIKANINRVFGSKNDALAEMLFRYMSNCTDISISTARVNYFEFLKKFDVIWPKKGLRKLPGESSARESEE